MAWNHPDRPVEKPETAHMAVRKAVGWRWTLAVLSAGTVVGLCWLYHGSSGDAEGGGGRKQAKSGCIGKKTPVPKHSPQGAPTGGVDEPGKGAVTNAITQFKPEMWMGHVVLKHTYTTNSNGRTSEFLYTDDGECHRINGWALDRHSLKTATDQLLGMATAEAGGPPLPIVDGLDDMFRKSLSQPVEIAASDSDDVKVMKERVNEARRAMKELMDEGMTFAQVLREHEAVANENIKIHDNAQAELELIVKSGDMEAAQKYCDKINLALQQMGVEQIKMPTTEAEAAAKREARRRRMLQSPFERIE